MGENAMINQLHSYEVVYSFAGDSTSEDTKNACKTFLEEGVLTCSCSAVATERRGTCTAQ